MGCLVSAAKCVVTCSHMVVMMGFYLARSRGNRAAPTALAIMGSAGMWILIPPIFSPAFHRLSHLGFVVTYFRVLPSYAAW
jgi:hypothetical protein